MTVVFWTIVVCLTVAVIGLLTWPLLKREFRPGTTSDREKTLSVYRQQFAELDQDRQSGGITAEQHQQAKRELERRLLEESAVAQGSSVGSGWRGQSKVLAGILAIVIPLASVLLYLKLGNPLALTHPLASTWDGQATSETGHQSMEGLDALMERLQRKLEQNPGDGVGWALLARSYVELGRHAEAVPIYEKAMKLMPEDAQLLADYADALGMLHGRKLEGKPEVVIQQALKLDPRNVKALMLAGTVAFDRRDFRQAAQYWEQARSNLPPDAEPELLQELTSGIGEARGLAKGGVPGPAATTASAPGTASGSTRLPRVVTGRVTLAPSLARKAAPGDTLFVFARALDGPPMPVAILRLAGQTLPFSFRLDDSNSPMPTRKLSDMDQVVIVARLSKSGDAMPQHGDLQGKSQPVKPGVEGVVVEIDSEIP